MSKNIYIDMDGVLADFNNEPNALERFQTEKGFFKKLSPLKRNIQAVKQLMKLGHNCFILSASPNETADGDKRKWLKKYLKSMPTENIIIVRNGVRKVDYMKTADGILCDDYSKNIREWLTADGNQAVKITADGDIYKVLTLM